MKYRRKPCEIEAVQFTLENWDELVKFTDGKVSNLSSSQEKHHGDCITTKYRCWLELNNNLIIIYEGEYIWVDDIGALHICDQFMFESQFDPIEGDAAEDDGPPVDQEESGGDDDDEASLFN